MAEMVELIAALLISIIIFFTVFALIVIFFLVRLVVWMKDIQESINGVPRHSYLQSNLNAIINTLRIKLK
jgi:hypothetical protein